MCCDQEGTISERYSYDGIVSDLASRVRAGFALKRLLGYNATNKLIAVRRTTIGGPKKCALNADDKSPVKK